MDALAVDDPRRPRIAAWLAALAADGRAFIESRPEAASSSANHRYWNGLGAAAAGVAAGDQSLLDWGIESARIGLAQVNDQGFLPRELNRGKRARDYHIYAIAPLVLIAEIAAAQGIDLYAEQDGALARAVTRYWANRASLTRRPRHRQMAGNVWDLLRKNEDTSGQRPLRDFAAGLPPGTIILVVAGSLCQDLTTAGRLQGRRGMCGDQSVLIHAVSVVWWMLTQL